ncbi:hypothetical protein [Bacillus thuringiensis]|uniref:hypothetical protein n=1 Tax=Bacillus thuringiensis TaxID=1428 RepID=UPI000BF83912|nr:hypothetical protein [Bacillus thuringiensis]PFN63936.1 hypothetical protein COJ75_00190 [Bacillus thuringiensis]
MILWNREDDLDDIDKWSVTVYKLKQSEQDTVLQFKAGLGNVDTVYSENSVLKGISNIGQKMNLQSFEESISLGNTTVAEDGRYEINMSRTLGPGKIIEFKVTGTNGDEITGNTTSAEKAKSDSNFICKILTSSSTISFCNSASS